MMNSPDDLDNWIRDVRGGVEQELEACAEPDLLDVLERAHKIDAHCVTRERLDEVQELAPVVELRRRVGVRKSEPVLTPWVLDTREVLERAMDRRLHRGIPSLPALPQTAPSWPRKPRRAVIVRTVGILGIVAVAASVLAWVGLRGGGALHERSVASLVLEEALHERNVQELGREVRQHRGAMVQASHRALQTLSPRSSPPDAPPPVVETPPENPEQWAAEAERRWRAGDLAGAEQLLLRVVRVAGKTRLAEMAYADLFSLAHQRHNGAGRVRLWRGYLQRFPHGRFSEDALSGLCRVQDDATCWKDYLERFPEGTYRQEALEHAP